MKTRRNYNNSHRRRKTRKRVMRGGLEAPPYAKALNYYNSLQYAKAFKTAYDNHQTFIDCEILYQLFLFDYKPEIKKLFLNQMKNEDKVKFKEVKNKLTTDDLIYEYFVLNEMIIFITADKSDSIEKIKQAQFTVLCNKFIEKINNLTTTLAFKCLLRAFVYSKLGYYYKTTKNDLKAADTNYTLARAEYEIYIKNLNPDTEANIRYYGIDEKNIQRLEKEIELAEEENVGEADDPFFEENEFVPEILSAEPTLNPRERRLLEMKQARTAKKVNEESLTLDTLYALDAFLNEENEKQRVKLLTQPDEGGRGPRRRTRRRHKKIRRTRRKLF